MRLGAVTDVGRVRTLNEDSYFVYRNENLLGGMVADGMGGENAGEVASGMAVNIVKEYIMNEFNPEMDSFSMGDLVKRALVEANDAIYRYSVKDEELSGMGTTAALAIVYKNRLIIAHVGDSRVYLKDKNGIKQVTRDHSYVEELLIRGEISREAADRHPAKNYITRAVGTEEYLKVDVNITEYKNEIVIICSDGLTNMVSADQISEIIDEHQDLQICVEDMVKLANQKGGPDNITVVAFQKE